MRMFKLMLSKTAFTVSVMALIALASVAAQAASVTVPFPEAGTVYVSATNGSGVIPSGGQSAYMWTAGDHVVDFFGSTGLGSVSSLSATFQIQNVLGSTNENVDVLLNGFSIGSFTAVACGFCTTNQTINFSSSFAPIFAPGYGLEFELTNTLATGDGSIAFLDGGKATLTGSVPEPATGMMMLFGIAGLGAAFVMKRKSIGNQA